MSSASFVRNGKKIIAIGRNYAEHIKELKNATPSEPFFFLKPTTSYLPNGGAIEIPAGIHAHHEVELAVVIGKAGRNIPQTMADSHIAGYALAIDVTGRNLQDEAKKRGLPWTAAKGFDTFTPIGDFIPKSTVSDPHNLTLSLAVQGILKQNGTTADMIFPISRLIEHVSSIMTLEQDDLILTGTPSGVGRIFAGDNIECSMTDITSGTVLSTLRVTVADREGGYRFEPART